MTRKEMKLNDMSWQETNEHDNKTKDDRMKEWMTWYEHDMNWSYMNGKGMYMKRKDLSWNRNEWHEHELNEMEEIE